MSSKNSLLTTERAHELADEIFESVKDQITTALALKDDWDSWQCKEGFLERWHQWRQEAHLLIEVNQLRQKSGSYSTFIESRNQRGARTPSGGIARNVHLHRRTPLTEAERKARSRERWRQWEIREWKKRNPNKRRRKHYFNGRPKKYVEGWRKHRYPNRPRRGRPPYTPAQKEAALRKKQLLQSLNKRRHYWLLRLARYILENRYVEREKQRKKDRHTAWPSRATRKHHTKGEGRGYTPHKKRKRRNPYPFRIPFTAQHWKRMLERAKGEKTVQKVLLELARVAPRVLG